MSKKTLVVRNPYDLSTVDEVSMLCREEVEQAIIRARNCFDDPSVKLPAHRRISILEKTVVLMEERSEELARIACQEGGKPWKDTLVEVQRAIQGVKLAIENIGHIKGEQIPMDQTESTAGRLAFTTREPIGVVAAVSAFNHPLNLIIHQVVPAIAVGAAVLIKPANYTPLSCINFVSLLREAGLPEAWCQVLVCENEIAEGLVTDPRINFFSFIGSGRVGWYLRSKLAPGTRCALEHGGVAPAIVTEDADLETAIPSLVKGGFYHSGQVCVSVQRIYVHESVKDALVSGMVSATRALSHGDPMAPDTDVASLIHPKEVDRVSEWVTQAIDSGAELLIGGEKVSETAYAPTILLNPSEDAVISKSEVFGPVVCIYTYSTFEEAVSRANQLPYAFQAAIFSSNLNVALAGAKQLNATAVMLNDHTAFRADWMPFGGRGESGIGLGGIPQSMHEMTHDKMIVINHID